MLPSFFIAPILYGYCLSVVMVQKNVNHCNTCTFSMWLSLLYLLTVVHSFALARFVEHYFFVVVSSHSFPFLLLFLFVYVKIVGCLLDYILYDMFVFIRKNSLVEIFCLSLVCFFFFQSRRLYSIFFRVILSH